LNGLALVMLAAAATLPNQPLPELDTQRYLGTWHEIAHLPMFFQRQCVDSITATYTRRPDGQIAVRNACRTESGETDEAVGVARPVPGKAAALEVRFAPEWLDWLPLVWADYWVVDLDPGYQWAVVGGPSRKYLWILSRTPSMDTSVFEQIRKRAAQRGYAIDRLILAAPLH
jgi:apolipoprotein D and lipocalin family protein